MLKVILNKGKRIKLKLQKINWVILVLSAAVVVQYSYILLGNFFQNHDIDYSGNKQNISKTSFPVKQATPIINEPKIFKNEILKNIDAPDSWKTFSLESSGVELRYPDNWISETWDNYAFINNKSGTLFRVFPENQDTVLDYPVNDGVVFEVYSAVPDKNKYHKYGDAISSAEFTLNGTRGNVSLMKWGEYFKYELPDKSIYLNVTYRNPSPQQIKEIQTIIASFNTNPVKDSFAPDVWLTSNDFKGDFSYSYPAQSYTKSNMDSLIIKLTGPTQMEGTEIYDGINLFIESRLNDRGKGLMQITEEYYEENDANDEFQEEKEVKSISFSASLQGYFYRASGPFGDSDHIFISETGKEKYFIITKVVKDPTNQNFNETANKIIKSLKLL